MKVTVSQETRVGFSANVTGEQHHRGIVNVKGREKQGISNFVKVLNLASSNQISSVTK